MWSLFISSSDFDCTLQSTSSPVRSQLYDKDILSPGEKLLAEHLKRQVRFLLFIDTVFSTSVDQTDAIQVKTKKIVIPL